MGDGTRLDHAGTYAVVEAALPSTDPEVTGRSHYFIPYVKMTQSLEPELERKFWLVDVEAFVAPCCVIPDMGGTKDSFLRLRPRSQWLELYVDWLKAPHEDINEILED